MLKKYFVTSLILFMIFGISNVNAIPDMPYRIGGTLTILEDEDDKTGEKVTQYNDAGYIFVVTREDNNKPFNPPADSREGLNESDIYIVDVPSYDEYSQPDGLKPGERARIDVYKDECRLLVSEPANGVFTVGSPGDILKIDIKAIPCPIECEDEVKKERARWDADNNDKIGLAEAIQALQVVAGIRHQISE